MDKLKDNQLIDFNEKCAKFLGYAYSENYEVYNIYDESWGKSYYGPIWYYNIMGTDETPEDGYVRVNDVIYTSIHFTLKCDTDWNWLMRVKNKICRMDIVYEFETTFNNMWWFCHIRTNPSVFGTIYSEDYPTELEATIDVIDKFLELNFNLISGDNVNS